VHIEFNDDSHDNVVNVNNGIVINNNYNTVVDTIKAVQKNIGKRSVIVVGKYRELCK